MQATLFEGISSTPHTRYKGRLKGAKDKRPRRRPLRPTLSEEECKERVLRRRLQKQAQKRRRYSRLDADGKRKFNRQKHLRQHYRMTLSAYEALLSKQGGHCACCSATDNLTVDHDHSCCPGEDSCGKCIRGILCTNCNTCLGGAKDDLGTLRALMEYLRSWQMWNRGA